jgi:hypothetical protein
MNKFQATLKALQAFFLLCWNWLWPKAKCLWNDHRMGRMFQWAVFCFFLYSLVLFKVWPLVVQVALTKGANVNAGAFLGYWIDRTLFNSFDVKFDADPNTVSDVAKAARVCARGIIAGACILGLALGVGA